MDIASKLFSISNLKILYYRLLATSATIEKINVIIYFIGVWFFLSGAFSFGCISRPQMSLYNGFRCSFFPYQFYQHTMIPFHLRIQEGSCNVVIITLASHLRIHILSSFEKFLFILSSATFSPLLFALLLKVL